MGRLVLLGYPGAHTLISLYHNLKSYHGMAAPPCDAELACSGISLLHCERLGGFSPAIRYC